MRYLFWFLLFFTISTVVAQDKGEDSLWVRADENLALLPSKPEKAHKEAQIIEAQAIKVHAWEAELKAIQIQCEYHKIKNDFIRMMESAKKLSKRAAKYDSPYYQVIAKRYLFESYLFTGLPERAFDELQESRKFVNRLNKKDSLHILERSNFYIAYSNFYLLSEDYRNQLKYIKLSGREIKALGDSNYREKLLSIHYSNLASSFLNNKTHDSAAFYARLSQELRNETGPHQVKFNNLMVLGEVGMNEANYEEALRHFKEAEEVTGYKNHVDSEQLFENIIKTYEALGDENLASLYRMKQDSLKLVIAQSQNESLHSLLKGKKEDGNNGYFYILIVSVFVLLVIIFLVIRKNKVLREQENKSAHVLEEFANNPSGEDFSKLLELLKKNDPSFMIYFEKSFPGFLSGLTGINPKLSPSDIEFCALLKLKLSTKEIAQYIFRAPQTIRNKKYIIRKKLGIPKDTDIYEWFEKL